MDWYEAKESCLEKGFLLAEPLNTAAGININDHMINIRVDEPAWIGAKFHRKQIEKYQGKLLFLYLHIINNSTFVNNNNVYSNVYLNIPHICTAKVNVLFKT